MGFSIRAFYKNAFAGKLYDSGAGFTPAPLNLKKVKII